MQRSNKRAQWQFSLATLMIFVAVAAVGCAVVGLVGYGLAFGITCIAAVFWTIDRLISNPPDDRKANVPAAFKLPGE